MHSSSSLLCLYCLSIIALYHIALDVENMVGSDQMVGYARLGFRLDTICSLLYPVGFFSANLHISCKAIILPRLENRLLVGLCSHSFWHNNHRDIGMGPYQMRTCADHECGMNTCHGYNVYFVVEFNVSMHDHDVGEWHSLI